MPELPEVETVVRDLRAAVVERTFVRVEATHPKIIRFPTPSEFSAALPGRRITAVGRRGKFIICTLDGGSDDLVVHLGMTGHLRVTAADAPIVAHTHVRTWLDDGRELRYDDARRFGRVLLGPRAILETVGVMPPLGIEPLSEEFTADAFRRALARSTRSLKGALLDQTRIAGLGNIYIDEACHRAGVRPTRRCNRLTRAQCVALHSAIGEVLSTAVENRGSTIDDYRDVWNGRGKNQEVLRVYGRGDMPCLTCATRLRSTVVAGRTTVYCPTCQR